MTVEIINRSPFLMQQKSKVVDELMKKPFSFLLITQIARRAKRTDDFNLHNLEIGESLIGDYKSIGATEQQYRTAKSNLQKWGFATFRSTNKGTIAKLIDTRVYDINEDQNNEPTNRQTTNKPTGKQRTNNEPTTTNKKKTNKEGKENKEIKKGVIFDLPNFIDVENWNSFVQMRKEIKKPLTDSIAKGCIKNLTKFEDKKQGNANQALENSIAGGYQGLFEPKESTNFNNSNSDSGWRRT